MRQRSEAQDRLRWLLYDIDPGVQIPAGALNRKLWRDRVARRLARDEQTVAVRIARDPVRRCRTLTRGANELEREIALGAPARSGSSKAAGTPEPARTCSANKRRARAA